MYIAITNQIRNNKTDFNDVARSNGIAAVKDVLNRAISYQVWRSNLAKNGINLELNQVVKLVIAEQNTKQKNMDREFVKPSLSIKADQNIQVQERNNLQKSNGLSKQNVQKRLTKTEWEIN